MGGGTFNTTTHATVKARASTSTSGGFDADAKAKSTGVYTPSPMLNPLNMKRRDSLRTSEHPNAKGVIVALDGTGSMGYTARAVFNKLGDVHTLLTTDKTYFPDAQILFACVGDVVSDHLPLQIGHFESDNRQTDQLMQLILEGNGGGQTQESYELILYAAARLTHQDCWQDGEKGYLFIIGDEMARDVDKKSVQTVFGEEGLRVWGNEGNKIPIADIMREVQEKYEVFFLIPQGSSHYSDPRIPEYWKPLVGNERFITIPDVDQVAYIIASTLALCEGAVSLTGLAQDLTQMGVSSTAITNAVALVDTGNNARTSIVNVTVTGSLGNRPKPRGTINK